MLNFKNTTFKEFLSQFMQVDEESGTYLNADEHYMTRGFYSNRPDRYFLHRDSGLRLELIECNGGGEGGAEDCTTIVKIGEQYVRIDYKYYSHHGFDFDYAEITEVEPFKVWVTKYRSI